jgi:hypothetical protein
MRVEMVLQQASPLVLLIRLETLSELIAIGHPTIADTPLQGHGRLEPRQRPPRPPIGRLLDQLLTHATCAIAVVPRTWHQPKDRASPSWSPSTGRLPR